MKFDHLINKKRDLYNIINNTNKKSSNDEYFKGLKKGILDSFDLFNTSILFYKKYKDNVKLLMKEQNNLWLKWVDYYNKQKGINRTNYNNTFNKWLFEKIFSTKDNVEISNFLELF